MNVNLPGFVGVLVVILIVLAILWFLGVHVRAN